MAKLNEIDLVNYVINNGATLKEAADYFEVSLSTIKKAMKKVKDGLNENSEIYQELDKVSKANELLGKKKGGQSLNSGVKRSLTLEQMSVLAMELISNDLTLDSASKKFGIPKSTLWDNFKLLDCEEYSELYNDLIYIYKCHNEGIGADIIYDVEERKNNNTWLKSLQRSEVIKLETIMQKYNLKLEEYYAKSKNNHQR